MIKNHLPNILTYFKYRISNAVAEGLNSKIQTVKVNARGYRSFDGFRNSILFYCGGLDMKPRGYANLRRTRFFCAREDFIPLNGASCLQHVFTRWAPRAWGNSPRGGSHPIPHAREFHSPKRGVMPATSRSAVALRIPCFIPLNGALCLQPEAD